MRIAATHKGFMQNTGMRKDVDKTFKKKTSLSGSCYMSPISFKSLSPSLKIINKQLKKTESKANVFDSVFSFVEELNKFKENMNFNWNNTDKGIRKHIYDEVREYKTAIKNNDGPNKIEEIGDIIHIVTRWGLNHDFNPAKILKEKPITAYLIPNDKMIKIEVLKAAKGFSQAIKKQDSNTEKDSFEKLLKLSFAWAKHHGIDPIKALHESVDKVRERLELASLIASKSGKQISILPQKEQLVFWDKAKKLKKTGN